MSSGRSRSCAARLAGAAGTAFRGGRARARRSGRREHAVRCWCSGRSIREGGLRTLPRLPHSSAGRRGQRRRAAAGGRGRRPAAHALLTTPAAGKFYRRGPAGACALRARRRCGRRRRTRVAAAGEHLLSRRGRRAAHACATSPSGARFIGWEIGCLGLPANALDLATGRAAASIRTLAPAAAAAARAPATSSRQSLAAHAGVWPATPPSAPALAYPARRQRIACARGARDWPRRRIVPT